MQRLEIVILAILYLLLTTIIVQASDNEPYGFHKQLKSSAEMNYVISRKYILGANDVISIYVYDSEEFNREKIRVHPDGNIIIAPIGVLKVAGLTLEDLNNLLVKKYKKYLKDPQITINLDQTKPFVVYINGAVLNPGSYELSTDTTNKQSLAASRPEVDIERRTPLLSNIILAAGGLRFDADLEHVKVSNPVDKSEFEINLMELLNGDSTQDIYLVSGDVITIPELPTPLAVSDKKYKIYAGSTLSPRTIMVKVFGYVNNPGLVKLDSAQSLNLNSAISAAGGYLTDSAYSPKKVYISRADVSGKLVTRTVNPMSSDIVLMPNDIVYIPEKSRPLVGKAFDYMVRVFNPVNTFANTYNNWALMFNPTRYQVIGK